MQESVRYVLDKSALEKKLEWLRKRNSDLEGLRCQLSKLHSQTSCASRCSTRKSMPQYFTEVRQISGEAHGALTASFSCGDTSHGEHSAAVCLDTEVIEEIRLNMAITINSEHSKSVLRPGSDDMY
jgi:hypothetical protein